MRGEVYCPYCGSRHVICEEDHTSTSSVNRNIVCICLDCLRTWIRPKYENSIDEDFYNDPELERWAEQEEWGECYDE